MAGKILALPVVLTVLPVLALPALLVLLWNPAPPPLGPAIARAAHHGHAASKPCKTQGELLADVASDFLMFQQAAAGMCDSQFAEAKAPAPGPMGKALLELEKKHRKEFFQLATVRRDFFKRVHGGKWKEKMREVDGTIAWRLMNALRLGPAACKSLGEKLAARRQGPWSAIQAELEKSAKRNSGGEKICK